MEIEKAIFNEKLKEYQETVEKQNKQIEGWEYVWIIMQMSLLW